MLKKLLIATLCLSLVGLLIGSVVGYWGYLYLTRDLPDFHTVEDYRPPAVTSVKASDGTVVAEFYEERRYPVRLSEIPVQIRKCFLAAEDANFYHHPGIDPTSILRAIVKNLRAGQASQGGSTITQQVVKNMLLTPEKKLLRKAKEAILSYRIEKRLSKDGILEIYLNQIFFGNKAYGIKAAARAYFHKELSELTLAEGAMLAALPKAPSSYSPLSHYLRAKRRQAYVLQQMVNAGFITEFERDTAYKQDLKLFRATETNYFSSPYYVAEVRRILSEKWKDINIDRDGLVIDTALDVRANQFTDQAIQRGLREVDKRRGWRGPIGSVPGASSQEFIKRVGKHTADELAVDEVYPAMIVEFASGKRSATVDLGGVRGPLDLAGAGWARKFLKGERVSFGSPEQLLSVGDIVEVALKIEVKPAGKGKDAKPAEKVIHHDQFVLDQTPEIEGAMSILDPHSGKVVAITGGYSYQRNQFNRITQSYRQPGSTFKPIVYLAAVDGFRYTPSTIVHDERQPHQVGDQVWDPENYDGKELGAIPLQVALERSRNLVSVDIVSKIGLDAVISYAQRLGIESKIGRNLSVSLGTSEVTPLELTRAYGVFAAKGVLYPSVLITKITDRFGKVLFDYDTQSMNAASQRINENSAFIMAHMMEGVVQRGTGYKVKELNRPVAGKTGTTNNQMDTWFIGYTPQWVCGVWVGFDQKRDIGDKETGGRVAAPIFVDAMGQFLSYREQQEYERLVTEGKAEAARLGIEYVPPPPLVPQEFSVPPGVDPFWVNKETGVLADSKDPGAILQYFLKGTEPPRAQVSEDSAAYLESPDL